MQAVGCPSCHSSTTSAPHARMRSNQGSMNRRCPAPDAPNHAATSGAERTAPDSRNKADMGARWHDIAQCRDRFLCKASLGRIESSAARPLDARQADSKINAGPMLPDWRRSDARERRQDMSQPFSRLRHPFDVAHHPTLEPEFKRALLASWASDRVAVMDNPALRRPPASNGRFQSMR